MAVRITRTTLSVCGCYKLLGNGSPSHENDTRSVDVANSWEMAVRITRTIDLVCGCFKCLEKGSPYHENDPLSLWVIQTPWKCYSVSRERHSVCRCYKCLGNGSPYHENDRPTRSVDVTNAWEMAVRITRTIDPLGLWMLQMPGKWQFVSRERSTHSVCGCYKCLGNGSSYHENDRPTRSVDVTNAWEMAVRITSTTLSVCGC